MSNLIRNEDAEFVLRREDRISVALVLDIFVALMMLNVVKKRND